MLGQDFRDTIPGGEVSILARPQGTGAPQMRTDQAHHRACFNPRPSAGDGRSPDTRLIIVDTLQFQSSPVRRGRALLEDNQGDWVEYDVSILARPQGTGAPESTYATRERRIVSILARPQGTGAPKSIWMVMKRLYVSILARPQGTGAPISTMEIRLSYTSFNPRPSAGDGRSQQVRLRCAGRPCFNPRPSAGDGRSYQQASGIAWCRCFNPRPSAGDGRSCPIFVIGSVNAVSILARPQGTGARWHAQVALRH